MMISLVAFRLIIEPCRLAVEILLRFLGASMRDGSLMADASIIRYLLMTRGLDARKSFAIVHHARRRYLQFTRY